MNKNINLYFDLDMTLLYSKKMWTEILHDILKDDGYLMSLDEVKKITHYSIYPWSFPEISTTEFLDGKTWWEKVSSNMAKRIAELSICSLDKAKNLTEKFKDIYLAKDNWCLFDDTITELNYLKTKYNLYVISNHVPEVIQVLKDLNIFKLFNEIYISCYVGWEKPNYNIFKKALKDREKDLNIMVGDNFYCDVMGAIDNGMQAILVRSANIYNYDKYCTNLIEIENIIKEIENENR